MRTTLALALTLLAGAAAAQTPPTPEALAEARARFERGVLLHERGDDEGAAAELRAAWELSRRPSALYNLGLALEGLRRNAEAFAAFREYLALTAGTPAPLRADAEAASRRVEAALATLRVDADPAGAAVTLDGRPLRAGEDVPVDPGLHTARAAMPGRLDAEATFTLVPGERRQLGLALAPAPPPTFSLQLDGAPLAAAWVIDGAPAAPDAAAALTAGRHRVRVTAAGFRPWEGPVAVEADARLRVSLSPLVDAGQRRWAWASFAAAGALLAGTVISGALAVDAHAEFLTRARGDADVDALAGRGRALAVTADVLGALAVAGVAAGVVLFVRSAATPPSRAEVERLAAGRGVGLAF
ncbi:MAG: hypothetical protein U0324_33060 [Polyangiales bacterium]